MSFSKTAVVGSSLEPMAPKSWTLGQIYSTRPEFLPVEQIYSKSRWLPHNFHAATAPANMLAWQVSIVAFRVHCKETTDVFSYILSSG